MAFVLHTDAFADGHVIPAKHTCDGQDLSPSLRWSAAPRGSKSFTLIMDDPDAPGGTFTHWMVHDIPTATSDLSEGQRPGQVGTTLKNDFGRAGYGGPCPPRGHARHRYVFTLYALDLTTLGRPTNRRELEAAMHGHIVGSAKVVGTYERKR